MNVDLDPKSDQSTRTHPAGRPLKVCHLSTMHRATDSRLFDKEGRSLCGAGYEVTIVGRHEREECRDGMRLVPIVQPTGFLDRVRTAMWRVPRLALQEDADLYHFHDPELIPGGLLLKLLGKKVIYDVHEDYGQTVLSAAWVPQGLRRLVSLLWGAFERTAARAFDAMLVVDSNIRRKFPAHKTEMITNVPLLSFSRGEPKPPRTGPLRIVYVGTLSEQRGVFKVIEALDHLRSRNVEYHVIGAIEEPKTQQRLAAHPEVVCHGRLPWRDLHRALETADVGILPLQPDPQYLGSTGEGYTKIFEYMSLGLAVIYSDFPNLRTFMDGIGAGLAVDPTSPQQIAEAIARLHDDPALCRKLGENGRKAVRERFHWEKEEQKLLAVYARVLRRRAPRAGSGSLSTSFPSSSLGTRERSGAKAGEAPG